MAANCRRRRHRIHDEGQRHGDQLARSLQHHAARRPLRLETSRRRIIRQPQDHDAARSVFHKALSRPLLCQGTKSEPQAAGLLRCGLEQIRSVADADLADEGGTIAAGGSKGIGLAIAERFAAEGANIAICARNADEVSNVVKRLSATGVKSWGQGIDVADPAALKGWIEGAAAALGGIDTIVCNVSALAVGDTAETWEKSFRTDIMPTLTSV